MDWVFICFILAAVRSCSMELKGSCSQCSSLSRPEVRWSSAYDLDIWRDSREEFCILEIVLIQAYWDTPLWPISLTVVLSPTSSWNFGNRKVWKIRYKPLQPPEHRVRLEESELFYLIFLWQQETGTLEDNKFTVQLTRRAERELTRNNQLLIFQPAQPQ